MYQPDVSPLFSKNANGGSKGASGFGAAPLDFLYAFQKPTFYFKSLVAPRPQCLLV